MCIYIYVSLYYIYHYIIYMCVCFTILYYIYMFHGDFMVKIHKRAMYDGYDETNGANE